MKVPVPTLAKGMVRKNGVSIVALLVAIPALLYTLSIGTPREYAENARVMLAGAASMSASVPENPYNSLAAALAEKEAQLDQREAELVAQNSSRATENLSFGEILGMSSFFMSLLILLLVALNFYYDVRRGGSSPMPRKFLVDLR
jgi:hypothetical protein